jgi:hypothetical protein
MIGINMTKIKIESDSNTYEIEPVKKELPKELEQIIYEETKDAVYHFVNDGHKLNGDFYIMDVLGRYFGGIDLATNIMLRFVEGSGGTFEAAITGKGWELHGNYKSKVIYSPKDKLTGKDKIYIATHAYGEDDIILGDL